MWIYKLTNKLNGKAYVGQTCDLEARLYLHSRAYDHRRSSLHRAIRKYGIDAFGFEVLEDGITDRETLNRLEREWIAKLGTTDRKKGYNLTSGGEGRSGYELADSQRKKMSESRKGRKTSAYQKYVASITHKGKPKSLDHRRKISLSHIGIRPSSEALEKLRRPKSTEHIANMKRAFLLRPATRLITFNGETLHLADWSKKIGVTPQALRFRLKKLPPEVALTKPPTDSRFKPKEAA